MGWDEGWGRFGVARPPFSAPGAPALRALCEAAAARQGEDVCPRSEAARHCHLEIPGDSVPDSPTAAVQGLRPVGQSDLAPAWAAAPAHKAPSSVSQERQKNVREIAGEARFSREMAVAHGVHGDPAQARRDSPDPGRRHDGRGHLAAIFWRRAGRASAEKSRARLIQ